MKLILLLSFVCSVLFAEKVIIVDKNGNEHLKDFPSRSDTIYGLSKDVKIYFISKKDMPQYDYVTERIEQYKRFTDSIADGHKYPYCVYDFRITKLPDQVIRRNKEIAILEKESELLMNSVSDVQFKQYVSIALAAMIYQSRGNTLTAKQTEIIDKVFNFGLKAYQNYIVKEQLIEDLNININTDITKNWKE